MSPDTCELLVRKVPLGLRVHIGYLEFIGIIGTLRVASG
jgi:hypothetical protein